MKPDTSFILKSGHFHLLTTLTVRRSLARNTEQLGFFCLDWSMSASAILAPMQNQQFSSSELTYF
jgi:hypothetical protein